MPYTVARPRPVPSPLGLVVKNGSNARSMTSWGIPVPVSLTFRLTYRPGASPTRLAAWSASTLGAGGGDDELPAARHRVAGVDGQVDQDLLDLAGVGQHRAQPGGQVGGQLHVLAQGAQQQLLDSFDDVVEVQHAGLDDIAAGEGQQLVGEPGGALGGPLDLPDVLAHRPATRSCGVWLAISSATNAA